MDVLCAGGSWLSEPQEILPVNFDYFITSFCYFDTGFRIVRSFE